MSCFIKDLENGLSTDAGELARETADPELDFKDI
jgi:hypothetical protein